MYVFVSFSLTLFQIHTDIIFTLACLPCVCLIFIFLLMPVFVFVLQFILFTSLVIVFVTKIITTTINNIFFLLNNWPFLYSRTQCVSFHFLLVGVLGCCVCVYLNVHGCMLHLLLLWQKYIICMFVCLYCVSCHLNVLFCHS